MRHIIKVAKTFIAEVEVDAATYNEARTAVLDHFSCFDPTWQSGNCKKILNWDAPIYPQETKVLTPVDAVLVKQADGSYAAADAGAGIYVSQLLSNAEETYTNAELALVGVQLVEVFSSNPTLQSMSVSIAQSHEFDDHGGTYECFYPSVSCKCDESDMQNTDADVEDIFKDGIADDNTWKAIHDNSQNGIIFVKRVDLKPFLGMDRVSGVAVMKHLAQCQDSGFTDNVAKLEVQYV